MSTNNEIVTVLRQALAALENPDGIDDYNRSISDLAITSLRQAIAEAEKQTLSSRINDASVHAEHDKQRDQAREMIAEAEKQDRPCHVFNVIKHGALTEWEPTTMAFALPDGTHALYTSPPQRQPLTDEQIDSLMRETFGYVADVTYFVRSIEAAHGITSKGLQGDTHE